MEIGICLEVRVLRLWCRVEGFELYGLDEEEFVSK